MIDILGRRGFEVSPNVWLETSVVNADYLGRIDVLRSVPASIRFISLERLLGSDVPVNPDDIDWEIVGGESGPHARPMPAEWVEEIRTTRKEQGVPFSFKQ